MARKGVGERQPNMLGIDISKQTLACTLINDKQKVLWRQTLQNTSEGIASLLEKVSPETPWILEPTGRYGHLLVQNGQAAGRDLRLAAPKKAKAFLASIQSWAKTDKLDSRGLALFGAACPLPAYPVKEQEVETLDQLLSARKQIAKSVTSLSLQRQELSLVAPTLDAVIADLEGHLASLDKQIATLTKESAALEAVSRLDSVPGIGPVVAAAVTSRLSAKQFSHPDQFVAYCGLDIGVRQSGKHSGQTGLSKQGDAELRRLLYVAAQANLRCKVSPFKDQYERERAKGLSSTAALCAVSRKLAKVCWSLHRHGGVYDPSRVNQQPGRESSLSVDRRKGESGENKSLPTLDKEP